MFNLTLEERKVVLFLLGAALLGLGINLSVKMNSRARRFFVEYERLAKVDLNKAGIDQVCGLPGVSRVLGEKILAYRDTNGPFRDIEGLKDVKGIGEYRYEKLKDLFFVE